MDDNSTARRRHRRISAALPVRVSTIEPERDQWTGRPFFRATREHCANVSRGGAFVRTAEPLAPGRRILIELQLPNGEPLEAIGRVAWTRRIMSPNESETEGGIGVEFLGAASEQFSALERFLDTQEA
jgi:uncharacterized protein (TIGR02266 family)